MAAGPASAAGNKKEAATTAREVGGAAAYPTSGRLRATEDVNDTTSAAGTTVAVIVKCWVGCLQGKVLVMMVGRRLRCVQVSRRQCLHFAHDGRERAACVDSGDMAPRLLSRTNHDCAASTAPSVLRSRGARVGDGRGGGG
ncbi:hypothetical protein MTO96_005892 [Rhipicephalus appendiculatus]